MPLSIQRPCLSSSAVLEVSSGVSNVADIPVGASDVVDASVDAPVLWRVSQSVQSMPLLL